MHRVPVTVTWLEMTSPGALRPGRPAPDGVSLDREHGPAAARAAAALYREVGGPWSWRDRLPWAAEDWDRAINRPDIEVWVARRGEQDILGYFELERHPGAVEIKYFGLVPGAIGQGLGGWLLTAAVQRAWQLGATRVELNTCTLDGPRALPNYLARGFTKVREEQQMREVPE